MQPHDHGSEREPPEPLGSEATTTGTVKWWDDERGYGAIASADTAPWDIWCHFSAIEMASLRSLTPGESVEVLFVAPGVRQGPAVVRRLTREALRLDAELGDPTAADQPHGRRSGRRVPRPG